MQFFEGNAQIALSAFLAGEIDPHTSHAGKQIWVGSCLIPTELKAAIVHGPLCLT